MCISSRILRIWNPEGTTHSKGLDCQSPQSESGRAASCPLKGACFLSVFTGEARDLGVGKLGPRQASPDRQLRVLPAAVPRGPSSRTSRLRLLCPQTCPPTPDPPLPRPRINPRVPRHRVHFTHLEEASAATWPTLGFQALPAQPQIQTQASFLSGPHHWLPFW